MALNLSNYIRNSHKWDKELKRSKTWCFIKEKELWSNWTV